MVTQEVEAQAGTARVREVMLGEKRFTFPSESLQELHDSTALYEGRDLVGLRARMDADGYLLVRGVHDRDAVEHGRLAVLEHFRDLGGKLDPQRDWQDGVLLQRCGKGCVPFMEGKNDITHGPAIKAVLEGERVKAFFRFFLGGEPLTFDYKWLRGMYEGGFTGAHLDRVYMGRGTENLFTMWTPFGDVPTEMGTLAVCEASHRLPGFRKLQDTYGSMDAEAENLNGTGWFTLDPAEITAMGGVWKTADFRAGDILVFSMRTIHMSSINVTGRARISCDTRWQLNSEPTDPRYVGHQAAQEVTTKFGVYAPDKVQGDTKAPETPVAADASVSMEEKKRQWGFIE